MRTFFKKKKNEVAGSVQTFWPCKVGVWQMGLFSKRVELAWGGAVTNRVYLSSSLSFDGDFLYSYVFFFL